MINTKSERTSYKLVEQGEIKETVTLSDLVEIVKKAVASC